MCVAMEYRRDSQAIDWLLETARSQVGEDLPRFAFNGTADRRVVKDRNPLRRAQPRQRRFELQRFVHGLLHERLDRGLSPRAERAASEAAAEALHAGEADAPDFRRFPVEHGDAGIPKDLHDFTLLAALEVVIAQHGDDGNLD